MRIAIFGAGGVGGYFGGRLARAGGNQVLFIARGEHLQALRRHGLQVESVAGDFVVRPVEATDQPGSAGVVDAVLVCVKSWQVPAAAAAMLPMLGAQSFVVPLGNGVEAAEQLAVVVGRVRVVGGLCRIVSFLVGPGRIRHAGFEPQIEFGELDGRPSARVAALQAAVAGAEGVRAVVHADIRAAIWEKFLFIAPFSGVAALRRQPAGGFRQVPEARAMLQAAMAEVAALAGTQGVRLAPDSVERSLAFVDALPENATASMQRDLMEGRPSELEAQNGAVVRLARAAGLPVPVNESIYAALLPLERRHRGGGGT